MEAPPPPHPKSKRKNKAAPRPPSHTEDDEYEVGGSPVGAGYNAARGNNLEPIPPNQRGSFSRESIKMYGRKNLLDESPETVIGPRVKISGDLEFERLLRVDGTFEGTLISKGDLIIGPNGCVKGDIKDMQELLIDGKVIGNIQVEKIDLRDRAVVHGDITAKSVRMDPTVVVCGRLNVHPQAPLRIGTDGQPLGPEEQSPEPKAPAPAAAAGAAVPAKKPATPPGKKRAEEPPSPRRSRDTLQPQAGAAREAAGAEARAPEEQEEEEEEEEEGGGEAAAAGGGGEPEVVEGAPPGGAAAEEGGEGEGGPAGQEG